LRAVSKDSRDELLASSRTRFRGRIRPDDAVLPGGDGGDGFKLTTASIDAARSLVHRRGFSLLGRIVQIGHDDAFMPFLAEANDMLTVVVPQELPRMRSLLDRFELSNVNIIVSIPPIAVPFDKDEVDGVWVHGDALHRNHRRALLLEIVRCLRPGGLVLVHHYPTVWRQSVRCAKALVGNASQAAIEVALRRLSEGRDTAVPGNFSSVATLPTMLSATGLRLKVSSHGYFGNRPGPNCFSEMADSEIAARLRSDAEFARVVGTDRGALTGLEEFLNFTCYKRPRPFGAGEFPH
jgi:SAM-dependent methyltransferase